MEMQKLQGMVDECLTSFVRTHFSFKTGDWLLQGHIKEAVEVCKKFVATAAHLHDPAVSTEHFDDQHAKKEVDTARDIDQQKQIEHKHPFVRK